MLGCRRSSRGYEELCEGEACWMQNCLEQAGAQFIGRNELEAFLRGMME